MDDHLVETTLGDAMGIGSTLCLSCGMCCRGVLHPDALLDEDERPTAERYDLTVATKHDGRGTFDLPCNRHHHDTNGCTIYDSRFRVCRRYTCDLLRSVHDETVHLDDALQLAATARSLESAIYARIGGYDPTRTIWQRLTSFVASDGNPDRSVNADDHAQLLVDARMLSLLCNRHFEHRMHTRLNAAAPKPAESTGALAPVPTTEPR